MLRRMLRRRTDGDHEAGVTLVVVVALTAIMLVAVGAALTSATSGLRQANQAQSTTRALDAAYAGVQDYIAKLNADSTYPQYGNPDAAFSGDTVTLPAAANANRAFSLDVSATASTWAPVPGSSTASFRYEVDNSLYGTSGLLRLRSTGRYGGSTRTIVASIQQQGFINYLYFTDFETQDPLITGTRANCASYLWSAASRSTSSCPTISFASDDVLGGPIRSNDTITVCGSTFNGPVVTSNTKTPLIASTSSTCAAPRYRGGAPTYLPVLSMPATNTAMRAQTYADTATNPGCLYTGPTQITMSGGFMTVVSPWTKVTAVRSNGTAAAVPAPAACGDLNDLHSTGGARIAVPSNNLVYVQGVPTITTDPNYTALADTGTYTIRKTGVPSADSMPTTWNSGTTYSCTGPTAATQSGSSGSAGWRFTDGDSTIRYPRAYEDPATNWSNESSLSSRSQWDTTTPAYGCRNGDAYVSGTLAGKLTIATDNYIYATGDITYANPSSDILGLVGNNGVLVYNPMRDISWGYDRSGDIVPTGGTPMLPALNRTIQAAVLSPAHTFQVQNYNTGPDRGRLTVLGSIAQRYRGPVGTTGDAGYAKNYLYDARFATVTPPYYLKPTSASFRVSSYASTPSAFTSTGAPS